MKKFVKFAVVGAVALGLLVPAGASASWKPFLSHSRAASKNLNDAKQFCNGVSSGRDVCTGYNGVCGVRLARNKFLCSQAAWFSRWDGKDEPVGTEFRFIWDITWTLRWNGTLHSSRAYNIEGEHVPAS